MGQEPGQQAREQTGPCGSGWVSLNIYCVKGHHGVRGQAGLISGKVAKGDGRQSIAACMAVVSILQEG